MTEPLRDLHKDETLSVYAAFELAKKVAVANDGRHGDPLHSPYGWHTAFKLARHMLTQYDKWATLQKLCGYWQDGSCTTVTLGIDDATHTYHIKVGKKDYWGDSFDEALAKAIKRDQS